MNHLCIFAILSALLLEASTGFVVVKPNAFNKVDRQGLYIASLDIFDEAPILFGDEDESIPSKDADMQMLFSDQVHRDILASKRYLAASKFAGQHGLKKLATHLRYQSEDERMRALKFIEYAMHKMQVDLIVEDVVNPKFHWSSEAEMASTLLRLESIDTKSVQNMRNIALASGDEQLSELMEEALKEQVTIESDLKEIVTEMIPIVAFKP